MKKKPALKDGMILYRLNNNDNKAAAYLMVCKVGDWIGTNRHRATLTYLGSDEDAITTNIERGQIGTHWYMTIDEAKERFIKEQQLVIESHREKAKNLSETVKLLEQGVYRDEKDQLVNVSPTTQSSSGTPLINPDLIEEINTIERVKELFENLDIKWFLCCCFAGEHSVMRVGLQQVKSLFVYVEKNNPQISVGYIATTETVFLNADV